MRVSESRSAGRHRANGSIGAFAVVGPVIGGLTMSALVTAAVVLLAGGSHPDEAPGEPARTYTSERTVASDVPTSSTTAESTPTSTRTTSTARANATSSSPDESPTATRRARPTKTPPRTTTADATTTDGPPERCPGNQPEHVRRKVCD